MNPKVIAALLVGVAAGAAPSMVASNKAVVAFRSLNITAKPMNDGGVLYQISACGTATMPGQKYGNPVCTDKFVQDAGDYRSCVGNALQAATDKYEAELKKK